MSYPINIKNIDPSIEFYSEVTFLLNEARNYLNAHPWCKEIYAGWLFTNIGRAVCIFLFEIENLQSAEDNLIWVIVGDLPPMYLDTYNVLTTKEAIEVYAELVSDWIKKVEANEPLDECYPLDANTDKSSIELLKIRVDLLEKKITPNIEALSFEVLEQ